MKTALIVIGVILSPMILYLIFVILGLTDMGLNNLLDRILLGKTEEEELGEATMTRTGYAKRRKISNCVFLVLTIAFFAVAAAWVFIANEMLAGVTVVIFGSLVTLFPLTLFLNSVLTYEVIEDDGILVRRVFSKRKVKYSDMAYYKSEQGMQSKWTDLYVYAPDDKCLIRVIDGRVGTESLINAIEAHGIKKEIYWLSDKQKTNHTNKG